jgi:hypothetical protein
MKEVWNDVYSWDAGVLGFEAAAGTRGDNRCFKLVNDPLTAETRDDIWRSRFHFSS